MNGLNKPLICILVQHLLQGYGGAHLPLLLGGVVAPLHAPAAADVVAEEEQEDEQEEEDDEEGDHNQGGGVVSCRHNLGNITKGTWKEYSIDIYYKCMYVRMYACVQSKR